MAMRHGHHAVGGHAHQFSGWGAPHEFAAQHAFPKIDPALVRLDLVDAEQQGLVVDVELHELGVGNVDDRLAGLGEAVGTLGVVDVPGLVEPIDVGAMKV